MKRATVKVAGPVACAVLVTAWTSVGGAAMAADVPASTATKAILPVRSTAPNADHRYTEGVYETPTDADWYQLKVTKGQSYGLVASGGSDDGNGTVLSLFDNRGKRVGLADNSSKNEVTLGFKAAATATMFVGVQKRAGSTRSNKYYAVRATSDCGADLTTTCQLPEDTYHHGFFDFEGDHDFYKVQFLQGRTYDLWASVESNSCEIDLRVVGRDGRVLLRPNSINPGYNSEGPQTYYDVNFAAPYTGTYYVDVLSVGDVNQADTCLNDYHHGWSKQF